VEQMITRSYNLFKNFTDVWKLVNDKYVKKEGLGTRDLPADTCEDLFKAKPTLPSGDYWIDPNGGNPSDAVLVHCNATNYETCIWPKIPLVDSQEGFIEKATGEFIWAMKDVYEESSMEYAAAHPQIKMLRLKSESVRQNITYNCLHSRNNIMLLTDDDMTVNMNDIATTLVNDCHIKDKRTNVYEIETEELETLPIQDIAVQTPVDDEFGFKFEFGPICFT